MAPFDSLCSFAVLADQQYRGEAVDYVVGVHSLIAADGEILRGRQAGVHNAAPVFSLCQLGKVGCAVVGVGVECNKQVATPKAPACHMRGSYWGFPNLVLLCCYYNGP
jgi:hypothetical protein